MAIPQVAASGRQQKSIIVELNVAGVTGGDKRFEKQVSSVEIAPQPNSESWQGGTPDAQLTASGEPTWQASLTCIQAWHDPASMVRFLADNYGKPVTLTYYPHDDIAYAWQTTLTLPAPTMGGAVNKFNESTFSVPCTKPVPSTTSPATL